jgi:putative spermidine/putrescine transport system substrate-binding protein
MKELGDGSRDMHRLDAGLGHQPARARHRAEGSQGLHHRQHHWIPDTQFMCIPKGVSDEKLAVLLDADPSHHADAGAAGRRPMTRAISIPARR